MRPLNDMNEGQTEHTLLESIETKGQSTKFGKKQSFKNRVCIKRIFFFPLKPSMMNVSCSIWLNNAEGMFQYHANLLSIFLYQKLIWLQKCSFLIKF